MTTDVQVAVRPPYTVRIGRGRLAEVAALAAGHSGVAVVTDGRVAGLHRNCLAGLGDRAWIQLPRGEAAKTLTEVETVLEELVAAGLDRRGLVVGFGGGAVCDVAGLAASLYMRGVDVLHCPTTLLAQVDASVGGKTGVNLSRGKNLAGSFHQPLAVIADVDVLATLDDAELRSGLGEVVKTALLEGDDLLGLVERGADGLLARSADVLEPVIEACVRLKARVVAADEREAGPRKQLNLGHTFAHAIEGAAGFGSGPAPVPHGVAVAVGLTLALECSRRAGLLEDAGLPARVAGLLERLGLPPSLAALRATAGPLPAERLEAFLRHDKKNAGREPRFVLPRAAGLVELDVPLDPELVTAVLV